MGAESQFVFATCQVGTERALKDELAQRFPHLHPAYGRPGFLTFKDTSEALVTAEIALEAVLARAYGVCLGRVIDATAPAATRSEVLAARIRDELAGAVVQVWVRDSETLGDEDVARIAEATRVARELVALGVVVEPLPKIGQLVADVVIVEPDEWWLGAHVHSIDHPPAGGVITHPPEAPSRAYLKVEEAIRWFQLPVRDGDVALELGSAPGGVVYALLARGLKVVGVDPGEMAPVVAKNSRFKHLAMSAFDIRESDLPKRIDWVLLDMNTEPELGLRAIDHVARFGRAPTYGAILTLKLNQPSFTKRIPELVHRVRSNRIFARVYAKQLTSNRREITVVALTEKGLRRQ